ncbi:MAG TPA: hypothetical protein VFX76_07635 [Roseiflexaceae bacterium]|nr:hypothetical protein [Roseiflexaceae bacterium]
MANSALVAMLRTAATTVLYDYERLLSLAGIADGLPPVPTVVCLAEQSRYPFPAANTMPWQLEGVARALQAATHPTIGWQRAGVLLQSGADQDLNGYQPVLRALGLPSTPVPEPMWGANAVLLPTLRTDTRSTLGGALWCAAQIAASDRQPTTAQEIIEAFAMLRQRYANVCAVMDGTTAGNGPSPEVRNVLLASADPVALDAVAARLLGFDPLRDVEAVRLAHERGLGVGDPRHIELVGDADLANERWRFTVGQASFPARVLHRVGGSCRISEGSGLVARLYQERYHWPVEQRWIFESWLRGSEWGRLFARYQRLNLAA